MSEILTRSTALEAGLLTNALRTSLADILEQGAGTDLAEYFAAEIEEATGVALDDIFDLRLIDFEGRFDVDLAGDTPSVELVAIGDERLDYRVVATGVTDPDAAAEGTDFEIDIRKAVRDAKLPEDQSWTAIYSGLVEGPPGDTIDLRIDGLEENVTIRVGGTEVFSGRTGNVSFDVPEGAAREIEIAVTLPADDRTPPSLRIEALQGSADPLDIMELVRTRQSDAVEATFTFDDGETETLVFDSDAAMTAWLDDQLPTLGGPVDVVVRGALEVDRTGDHVFRETGLARDLIVGETAVPRGSEGLRLTLLPGFLDYSYTIEVDPGERSSVSGGLGLDWDGGSTDGERLPLGTQATAITASVFNAIAGGIADLANARVEIGDMFDSLGPIGFRSILDLSVGVDAEFAWDFDLGSFGLVSTSQPVSFDILHGGDIATGGQIAVTLENLSFSGGTLRVLEPEVADLSIFANFSSPDTVLREVGVRINTQAFVDADLVETIFGSESGLTGFAQAFENLAVLELQLDADITLDDAKDIVRESAFALGLDGSIGGFLGFRSLTRGLLNDPNGLSSGLGKINNLFQQGDRNGALKEFAGFAAQGIATAGVGAFIASKTTSGEDVQINSDAILPILAEALVIGPEGVVEVEAETGETVEIAVSEIVAFAEENGLDELLETFSEVFLEPVEIFPGLKLALSGPPVSVTQVTTGGDPTPLPGPIVTTTTSSLVSAELDVIEFGAAATETAVDVLLAVPGLPPNVKAALLAAQIGLALRDQITDAIEDGASAELTVDPAPVLVETLNAIFGLFDGLIGALNLIPGVEIPLPSGAFDPDELADLLRDESRLKEEIRDLIRPVAEGIGGGLEAALGFVLEAAVGALNGIDTALTALSNAVEDVLFGISGGLNGVRSALNVLQENLGDPLAQFGSDTFAGIEGALGGIESFLEGSNVSGFVNSISSGIRDARSGISDVIKAVIDAVDVNIPLFGNPANTVKAILSGLQVFTNSNNSVDFSRGLFSVFSTVEDAVDSVGNGIDSAVRDIGRAVGSVGDVSGDISDALASLQGANGPFALLSNALVEVQAGLTALGNGVDSIDAERTAFFSDVGGSIEDFDIDFTTPLLSIGDGLAEGIASVVQGIEVRADLDLRLFELLMSLGLDLEQQVTFTPSDVEVRHSFGEESVTTDPGAVVVFDVPVDAGTTEEVRTELLLGGSYDYEYAIRPTADIDLEFMAIEIFTSLGFGSNEPLTETFDLSLLGFGTGASTNINGDDNLVELPLQALLDGLLAGLATALQGNLGSDLREGQQEGLVDGKIDLFSISDVPLDTSGGGRGFVPVGTTVELAIEGGSDSPATEGPDDLDGTEEADLLDLLGGDDIFRALAGDDTVLGGAGDDTLLGGDDDDELRGGAGADSLEGGPGDDTLVGDADDDILIGGPGDDRYEISSSDTVIERPGEGRDVIVSGGRVILGNNEIERVIQTGTADLRIVGNGVATEITGNAGDNLIIGGGGGDTLEGGDGDDTFVFLRSDLSGPAARLVDFSDGDQIALDDRLFGSARDTVTPRAVTQEQIRDVILAGQANYDGSTGELTIDLDARGGPAEPQLLLVIEGGGRLLAEDLLLF